MFDKRLISLRVILIGVISMLILSMGIGLSYFNYSRSRAIIEERLIKVNLPNFVNFSEAKVASFLTEAILLSDYAARSPFVKDWLKTDEQDTAQIFQYLRSISQDRDIISLHIISGKSLRLYSHVWPIRQLDPQADPFYYHFLSREDPREFNIDVDKYMQDKRLYFFVNNKIFDDQGQYLGLADISLDLTKLSDLVHTSRIGERGSIYLVDKKGRIKLHRYDSLIDYPNNPTQGGSLYQFEGLGIVTDSLLQKPNKIFHFNRNGEHFIATSRFLPEFGWYLIAEVSFDELVSPYRDLLARNMVITLAFTLLSILVFIWMIDRIVLVPLNRLKHGLDQFFLFLQRKTDTTTPILVSQRHEIGKMASDINRQVEMIKGEIVTDKKLLSEMQDLICQLKEGKLGMQLSLQGSSPEINNLALEINAMSALLVQKIGTNILDIMRALAGYGAMDFSYPITKPKGEMELLVSDMGRQILQYVEEIKSQNEYMADQQSKIQDSKEIIEQKNLELEQINQNMQEINIHLEQLILRRTQDLDRTYSELDTFLYRSSHDLRRPLTTLRGLMQVAGLNMKDEAVGNIIQLVNKVVDTMDAMLMKLIRVSEINNIKDPEILMLNSALVVDMIKEAMAPFEQTIEKERIKIQWKIGDVESVFLPEIPLKTILTNLIENALVFRKKQGARIDIQLARSGNNLKISVRDNGIGIPEEIKPLVFNMYFKGSEVSTGNGLGLYVVKKAIDLLNAKIKVLSSRLRGSMFLIWIPLDDYNHPKPH